MIASTTTQVSYTGNASTVTAYSITFPLADADDLVAIETDEDDVETTLDPGDYTFTPTTDGNGRITGGSVVTDPAIPATSTILFKRVTPKTQALNIVQGSRLSAEALETALDKATMILQEIARDFADEDTDLSARLDALEA